MNEFKNIIIPISLFFISFTIYTYFAKVNELVRGTGKIIVLSNNKEIQHLEGGILDKLYVKEGDVVKKGDKIVKIKNTFFNTSLNTNKKYQLMNEIKIKRLEALIDGKVFKVNKKDERGFMNNFIINEKKTYLKYKEKINQINQLFDNFLDKKNLEIKNNQLNLVNLNIEREILKEKFNITKELNKNNTISRKEFLREKLDYQKIITKIELLKSKEPLLKKEIEEEISKTDLKKEELKLKWLSELNKIREELVKKKEEEKALLDREKRMIIYSPINGIISKINIAEKGIVERGKTILEIIPNDDEIIVEGEILDRDRARIWLGQKVNININSLPSAKYGYLKGEITYISADSYIKQNNNKVFYQVKIKIPKNKNKEYPMNKIITGMTTIINILTGEKTILEYIIKPLKYLKDNSLIEN
jgi:HlyD family secretion protein/adhesin transport system membrane fusion protein